MFLRCSISHYRAFWGLVFPALPYTGYVSANINNTNIAKSEEFLKRGIFRFFC